MSNIVNDVVEDYIRHTLKDADGLLKELEVFLTEKRSARDAHSCERKIVAGATAFSA